MRKRANLPIGTRCSAPPIVLALARRTGQSARVRGMLYRALTVVVVLGSANLAACSPNIDCSAVGYSDVVRIKLPTSMLDGRTSLRMCVDDLCNDEGKTGLASVLLSGTTLTLALPGSFEPERVDPEKSTVRLISTGSVAVDTSITASWKIDHHGGCTDSRYIDLRLDGPNQKLATI